MDGVKPSVNYSHTNEVTSPGDSLIIPDDSLIIPE